MTRPLNRAAVNGFLGGSEGRTKKLNRRALNVFELKGRGGRAGILYFVVLLFRLVPCM